MEKYTLALRLAYIPQQKGEGLFLHRVPRAVLMLRQRKKKPEGLTRAQAITDEHVRQARAIIQAVDSGTDEQEHGAFAWREQDVEWARETLFDYERRE